MNPVTHRIFFGTSLAILILLHPGAWAQQRPTASLKPGPAQVFSEILKPYRNINDYVVQINARVAMPAIRIPEFTATVYFKQPDQFHIETKRFAPIPRNSGVFNPLQFDPDRNRITHLRSENLNGGLTEVYRLEPLDAKSRVRQYIVWIGDLPARILQVESLSVGGTRGLVRISHGMVSQGQDVWQLPEKVHIHLTFPEEEQPVDSSTFGTRDNPISGGMRRLDKVGGQGEIDIVYSGWKINTGLDEGLFKSDGGR